MTGGSSVIATWDLVESARVSKCSDGKDGIDGRAW